MTLATYAHTTDNNFNLIRFSAALSVLISHSYAIATGTPGAERIVSHLDITLGSIAVDVFFAASGFLVTKSLLTRRSTIEFLWARVLRIYPALIVMVLLTTFLLGASISTTPSLIYFTNHVTLIYLLKCSTLFFGVSYNLPGVFENNPYPHAVNGSLWSMPFEVRMYAVLVAFWLVSRLLPRFRVNTFKIAVLTSLLVLAALHAVGHFCKPGEGHLGIFYFFFSGASFYILKSRIVISRSIFLLFAGATILSAVNSQVFFVVYHLTFTYLLLYISYVPAGTIRLYNSCGDYSYGVYIYAFPIQQTVATLMPGVSSLMLLFCSCVPTFLLAGVSWHLLERRALALKSLSVERTHILFGRAALVKSDARAAKNS